MSSSARGSLRFGDLADVPFPIERTYAGAAISRRRNRRQDRPSAKRKLRTSVPLSDRIFCMASLAFPGQNAFRAISSLKDLRAHPGTRVVTIQ